ncbi:hypothetical protein CPC08DRAFT_767947 [Agrocybe pediades]|nr:hypothetical protein CPC08DRAFT_767947 [Agrocybe pediades]
MVVPLGDPQLGFSSAWHTLCKRSHFKSLPRDQLRRPAFTQPSSNHQAIELEDPCCRRSISIRWHYWDIAIAGRLEQAPLHEVEIHRTQPPPDPQPSDLKASSSQLRSAWLSPHYGHVAVVDFTNPQLQTKPIHSPTAFSSSSAMTQTGTEAPTAPSTIICPAPQRLRPLSSIP